MGEFIQSLMGLAKFKIVADHILYSLFFFLFFLLRTKGLAFHVHVHYLLVREFRWYVKLYNLRIIKEKQNAVCCCDDWLLKGKDMSDCNMTHFCLFQVS